MNPIYAWKASQSQKPFQYIVSYEVGTATIVYLKVLICQWKMHLKLS